MNHPLLINCALRAKICLTLIGIGLFGIVPFAHARVTQINMSTEAPTFGGASFGSVGQYERIEGTISGEVDPKDPLNAVIVDIHRAAKNANGKVGYSADFQILRPMDLNKGNHRVIFELPNRGRTNVLGLFNDSQTGNAKGASGDPGNAFLMNQDTRLSRVVGTHRLKQQAVLSSQSHSRSLHARTDRRSPAGRRRSLS